MSLLIIIALAGLMVAAALWMAPYIPGMPGIRATKTAVHKRVFKSSWDPELLPSGKVINGTKSRDPSNTVDATVLQAGLIMGKITATQDYAPSILGLTSGALLAGAVTINVPAAVAAEIVRRGGGGLSGTFNIFGPPVASGVGAQEAVTFTNVVGGAITVTALANAYVAGSFILADDGSGTPITFIPDGYGIPLADGFGSVQAQIQFPELPITGTIESAQLINWPSDPSLQAWIIARLNDAAGGQFIFDTRY